MLGTKPAIKHTYADYLGAPGDKRYELIDGGLIVVGSPSIAHQTASMGLSLEVGSFVRERALGQVFHAPTDVILTDTDVVQPDLVFVSKERGQVVTSANIQGAPDLVVEILSPSTASLDRTTKRGLYAEHGVKEYWIADPVAQTVAVMLLRDGRFEVVGEYGREDALTSPTLPGLTISLDKVFQ
jgi:Uma2 family endonuclease